MPTISDILPTPDELGFEFIGFLVIAAITLIVIFAASADAWWRR